MDLVSQPTPQLPLLTEAETNRRFPVWQAFAELFLDSDPAFSHRYIRRVMDESPYTREQLWLILWLEVTPAFSFNLSLVAGEWAGWPEDYIRAAILRLQARRPWLKRLLGNQPHRRYLQYVEQQWQAILNIPPEPLP